MSDQQEQSIIIDYSEIIKTIKSQKSKIDLNLNLITKTENFTDLLYQILLDISVNLNTDIPKLEKYFFEITDIIKWNKDSKDIVTVWKNYVSKLPDILACLELDGKAFIQNDPAANSIQEVYLAYPGFRAIAIYRLSHPLYLAKVPLIPRLMSEYAHRITGTDINPGAQIGKSFFIDHATGVVIGETTIIHNNVSIYQGVTLGGLTVKKELKNIKRHPTIEDNVTIYANATILGGETIIGANSTIGGNAWITKSIGPNSLVTNDFNIKSKTKIKKNIKT